MLKKNLRRFSEISVLGAMLTLCLVFASFAAAAEEGKKSAPAKSDVTGRYEGTAKDNENQDITVAFDLTEKEGVVSGNISSSHGDFTITKGSRQGDTVTLEFDANGSTGTISLKRTEDKLTGTWTAGEQGGSVDVKKVAAQEAPPKSKS